MLKRFCKLLVVISFVLSFFCAFGSMHSVAFAEATVQYHITDTYLGNGYAEVRGYFTNANDRPVAITKYRLGVTFINQATGKVIYSNVKVFDVGRLYVDKGKAWQKFIYRNPNIRPNTNAKFSSYNRYVWWEWCNRK